MAFLPDRRRDRRNGTVERGHVYRRHVFRGAAFKRLVLAALIRLMGSYYLLYLVVFTFGMSFGYTLSMLSVAYGMRSILFMAAYMFPQYLIYIPLMDRVIRFADRQMGALRPVDKRKTLAACLLFLTGCLLEVYVNPRILAAVIKIFS